MSEQPFDLHLKTVDENIEFQRFMDILHGPDWRTRLTRVQQRFAAKSWNFGKMYGLPPDRMEAAILHNSAANKRRSSPCFTIWDEVFWAAVGLAIVAAMVYAYVTQK